jgi:6-phosphogluconate dehydrogenase
MRDCLQMTADEMRSVFLEWNKGDLDSYLIEITADILGYKDTDGNPLIDKILDTAGQKGTGKWASMEALDESVPLTLISEAVFARSLSALKNERIHASKILPGPKEMPSIDKKAFLDDIKTALYAAKIVSYGQGYALMKTAAKIYGWNLNFGEIALMWRGGCIIRSAFLGKIKEAYDKDSSLDNLLLDGYFSSVMSGAQEGWRRMVSAGVLSGIPLPAFTSALAYYDGYRCEQLPANLLQAQRDFFGAHTYERTDRPRGEFFHTNWTGTGGDTAASTYNA